MDALVVGTTIMSYHKAEATCGAKALACPAALLPHFYFSFLDLWLSLANTLASIMVTVTAKKKNLRSIALYCLSLGNAMPSLDVGSR